MAAVTTMIVSGPLCADAADCRLLGSVLFGEELAAGDAAGLRIGVVRDAVSEDVDPGGPRGLRGGDRGAARARPAARCARSRCADLEAAALAAVLIANTEGLGGVDAASGSTSLDPELSPINRGFAQVPDAAAGGRERPGARGCGR